MNFVDLPIVFDCEGDRLVGVLSVPETPIGIGLVVIVGGPQYRAGSHRQFVHLARAVAAAGVATLRFDYRGMGDSEGSPRPFDAVDADIACAVGELKRHVPAVRRVVLWGLCDGASAAFIAFRSLPDIAGAIALNPWVRSEASLDQAILHRYYVQRVLSREFWAKLASGRFELFRALREFARRLLAAISGSRKSSAEPQSFRDRMTDGLKQFRGSVLIVLSGRDLTAQEYAAFAASDSRWKSALAANPRVVTETVANADHTLSSEALRSEVERMSIRFVSSLNERPTSWTNGR